MNALPDVTGTNTPAEAPDATGAKFDGILTMLDGLTDEQLAVLGAKVREIAGRRK